MTAGVLAVFRAARLAAGSFFLTAALGGCAIFIPQTEALRQTMPANLPERIELSEVPFFPQKDYQCGPAALATALADAGVKITPDDLVEQVYLPERHGSLQVEMLAAARRYGIVSYQLAPRFEDLLREVAAGNPVIVLQDYGVWPVSIWHYAVVVGYDYQKGELLLRSGEKPKLSIPFAVLEYTWKESEYWAMVTMPPDRIPVTANESDYLAAIAAVEHAGNHQAAKQAYAAFLKRWPDNLTAAIGLANMLYAMGELRETEHVLRRAAGNHPESVAVLNNLAQTLSDQGRNNEAMVLIERAGALGGTLAPAVEETRQLIALRMSKSKIGQLNSKK
jgi:tetratricopeptide (TPR) repeat protein